jgi:hypothetical protein
VVVVAVNVLVVLVVLEVAAAEVLEVLVCRLVQIQVVIQLAH